MKIIIQKRNRFLFPVLFAMCIILSNYTSDVLLYLAVGVVIAEVYTGSIEDNFYFSFFLIPNIRILDDIGVQFVVNILIVLPLIKYLYLKHFRVNIKVLIDTIILAVVVLAHSLLLETFGELPSELAWLMSFFFCASIMGDKTCHLDKKEIMYHLTMGIVCSTAVYLVCDLEYAKNLISRVLSRGRLVGYASDPNYYALYICLAIAILFSVRRKGKLYYVILGLLVGLGLLTNSKMCILLMALLFFIALSLQLLSKRIEKCNLRFWGIIFVLGIVALFVLRDFVAAYIFTFLKRMGISNGTVDVTRLTSERLDIVLHYIHVLGNNFIALIFGYGFQYVDYLSEPIGFCAHNTYLDLILSWGIIGIFIFSYILVRLTRGYFDSKIEKHGVTECLPVIALGLSFISLSCFNATMFWWVLAAAIISFRRDDTNDRFIGAGQMENMIDKKSKRRP